MVWQDPLPKAQIAPWQDTRSCFAHDCSAISFEFASKVDELTELAYPSFQMPGRNWGTEIFWP